MINDGKTKIIARLHKQFSPRALNIYNPYFEEVDLNAVFLLFYNPDPKLLVQGIKNLNFAGAVTVGFETDPEFAKLVDEYDESSRLISRIGFIKNINGKLKGYYQGGLGELRSILSVTDIEGKNIVIIGSGNVAQALLFEISKLKKLPKNVTVLNRSVEKIKNLKKHDFVKEIAGLEKLNTLSGDILVNATRLGGSEKDDLFTEKIISNFKIISDVTFETENTNLIQLAKKLKKNYATGWDMFTFQGQVVLETILDAKIDPVILKKHVIAGLSQTVK